MKLRSLVLSALLALGIAPMANAAEEVIPTVSSFDFLVDNSGSMLTSPLLNARSKMDLAKDVMARVNAQIPNLPYQGSVHLFSPDGTPQPFGNWDRAGMAQAIGKVVHEGYTPRQAFEVYQEIKHSQGAPRGRGRTGAFRREHYVR